MTTDIEEHPLHRYLSMVERDDYAAIGSVLTDDAQWTIVPIGHTWAGRRSIESMALVAGRRRRHDRRSRVEITRSFTAGEHACVEYSHKLIVRGLGLRMTIDGYCLVFHIRDGRFDTVNEYISPSRRVVALAIYALLPLLPVLARRQLARMQT